MRFLADECFPGDIVRTLREIGHDVRYATETDARSPDDVISRIAFEEGRIVLTADYGFGEAAVRYRTPYRGVVLIGLNRLDTDARCARVVEVVREKGEALLGNLTVIQVRNVRARAL